VLIAIEGVDGAGKRTLSQGLRAAFEAGGRSVATLAFPRYSRSLTLERATPTPSSAQAELRTELPSPFPVIDGPPLLKFACTHRQASRE